MLGGLLLGILIMGIFWPERIAKLKDGTEPIVKVDGKVITADDLYGELKNSSGLSSLLSLIDHEILDDMYDVEEEANEYAKSQSEYYYSIYESYYGYTKEQFLEAYGYANEDLFFEFLKNEYLEKKYYEEYLEKKLTDEEIQKFYDKKVFGPKRVYIFSSTDEKNDLESVRDSLKKGASYDDILKKYSKITSNDLGMLTYDVISEYSDAFKEALYTLQKGEYTKVLNDDSYGSFVLYVTETQDKPSYDEALENVKKLMTEELDASDEKLHYQAFIELRDEKGIKFSDTGLEKEYNDYKKQYK